MKVLLVGEMNPYGADPYYALYPLPEHASGGRLARILGLSEKKYLDTFDRANLCEGRWSLPAARSAALLLRARPGPIVMLGAKVSAAFGYEYTPFLRDERFLIIPHPSGLNRAWNATGARDLAQRAVMQLVAELAK